jgi:hypothetical protein
MTRAGEIVTELVKRGGHNSVGDVERLIHTISMVDINV